MRSDLTGSVALVTGGAKGIGQAIAAKLAENGASIVVADIDIGLAEATAAAFPTRSIGLRMDVRNSDEVEAGLALAIATFGKVDILVNNAGVNTTGNRVSIDAFPIDEWRRIISVDLDGLFYVSRAVTREMLARKGGRVINIASIAGIAALRLQSPYIAAKGAVIQLTRSMALELGGRGVNVNAIAPGSVVTELTRPIFYADDGSFKEQTKRLLAHIPLGRPGTAEEIAEAALFLAAPESAYVNGHTLVVDGGWVAGYSA